MILVYALTIAGSIVFAQGAGFVDFPIVAQQDSIEIELRCRKDTVPIYQHKVIIRHKILTFCNVHISYNDTVKGQDIICESSLNPIDLHVNSKYGIHVFKDGQMRNIYYGYNNQKSGEETLTVTADYNGVRRVIATKTFMVTGNSE